MKIKALLISFVIGVSLCFSHGARATEETQSSAWLHRLDETIEVISMWSQYLEDQNVKRSDPRWETIVPNAIHLINALEEFDCLIPYKQLPPEALLDLHLILGVIPIHESGLKPNAIGKRGEIGLFQIKDSYPRMGHSRKEVLNNSQLQIRTGVRWFLKHMSVCKNLGHGEWSDWYWTLPMSIYMAGVNKGQKNGRCFAIRGAKRRLKTFKKYKKLVRAELRSH